MLICHPTPNHSGLSLASVLSSCVSQDLLPLTFPLSDFACMTPLCSWAIHPHLPPCIWIWALSLSSAVKPFVYKVFISIFNKCHESLFFKKVTDSTISVVPRCSHCQLFWLNGSYWCVANSIPDKCISESPFSLWTQSPLRFWASWWMWFQLSNELESDHEFEVSLGLPHETVWALLLRAGCIWGWIPQRQYLLLMKNNKHSNKSI